MNIYLPSDLRNRMRPYDDVINWSKVAARAFEAELAAHMERISERSVRARIAALAHKWMKDTT